MKYTFFYFSFTVEACWAASSLCVTLWSEVLDLQKCHVVIYFQEEMQGSRILADF